METRIDHVVGGIYRISTMTEAYGITFNQFLIDDERPTLVHTGDHFLFENIRAAIREVLDPATLANLVLLHWEGDEIGCTSPVRAGAGSGSNSAPPSSPRRAASSRTSVSTPVPTFIAPRASDAA